MHCRAAQGGHCFRDACGGDLRILHPTSSKLRPPQRSRIDLRGAQLRAFCRTDVAGHARGPGGGRGQPAPADSLVGRIAAPLNCRKSNCGKQPNCRTRQTPRGAASSFGANYANPGGYQRHGRGPLLSRPIRLKSSEGRYGGGRIRVGGACAPSTAAAAALAKFRFCGRRIQFGPPGAGGRYRRRRRRQHRSRSRRRIGCRLHRGGHRRRHGPKSSTR